MANSAALSFEAIESPVPSPRAAIEGAVPLASIELHEPAWVHSIRLDDDLAAWLRAVGIREGESIVVLRRAIFGGPIHVRTGAGGEFALNRSLARAIVTMPLGRVGADRAAAE